MKRHPIFGIFLGLVLMSHWVAPIFAFSDIEASPYKEAIEFLENSEVLEGYADGTFKPEALINRAEFLRMVFAAMDEEAGDGEGECFPDVQNEWYAPYVCAAKNLGIVGGYPDGTFHPEQMVNFAEAFKISVEAFGFEVDEPPVNPEKWYLPSADFVHENGIFSKYAYFPGDFASRGEIAFLIYKVLPLFSGVEPIAKERYAGSEGCGLAMPPTPPGQFLLPDGTNREAIVAIPTTYDKDEPLPIVFAFHGRTSPNTLVRSYYRLERAAEGAAIFVYPAGTKNGSSFSWSSKDYEFFDLMLERLSKMYCIDMDQVHAAGHSLGAWFVNSLACARGDVLRGVTTLGGSRSNSKCTGPVAVMQWHNPDDTLAPFSGAVTTRDQYLTQNQCSGESVPVEPAWGSCVEYLNCLDDAPVVWCPHELDMDPYTGEYYPHNWPKEAGQAMWDFLQGL